VHRWRRRWAGLRSRLGLGVAAVVAGVALAGCSVSFGNQAAAPPSSSTAGAGAASADPSGTGTGSAAREAAMLKFAQCMRSHGVNMPDPGSNGTGGFSFRSALQGVSPTTLRSAMQACRGDLPSGGFGDRTFTPSPQMKADLLKFAACMRKNGVPNYPDPNFTAGGGFGFFGRGGQSSSGINPQSPAFQKAAAACRADLPFGRFGGGRFGNAGGSTASTAGTSST
jgi:hypothetical protein